jgi:hypothetical protein
MFPTVEDLAPGDTKSAGLNLAGFEFHRIRSETDLWFEPAYQRLWAEFGEKNEMEHRATLAARFALAPEIIYEMVFVQKDGHFAAVRDHTAIPANGEVVVHLSHNLVAPEYRRTGLSGWMRALPVATAREIRSGVPITLAAEMEFDNRTEPGRAIRLRAYEKAGFTKADPSRLTYHQPDFRAPAVIDETGGPDPVPFQLILRRVGRESESEIKGAELRRIVGAIYRMYGAQFRSRDMAHPALDLSVYPQNEETVRLVPPTRE